MVKFTDQFWKLVEAITLIVFVVMLLLTISQIIFRYVLSISVPWTEEAARWFYVWQIFLGSALALRERIHLKVTLVTDRFSPRVAAGVHVGTLLLEVVFFTGILVGSVMMMGSIRNVTAGSFSISMVYLYLALPISFGLMVLVSLGRFLHAFLALIRPVEE
ncbi:MAG: TRAP transporter small permease [Spirochaetales bacterium]|nr:TRAP transporter small permease [Spirochaetales bacterium]